MNDIIFNEETGTIDVGRSDELHIQDLLFACPYTYRKYPHIGACVHRLIQSNLSEEEITDRITRALTLDGLIEINVDISGPEAERQVAVRARYAN